MRPDRTPPSVPAPAEEKFGLGSGKTFEGQAFRLGLALGPDFGPDFLEECARGRRPEAMGAPAGWKRSGRAEDWQGVTGAVARAGALRAATPMPSRPAGKFRNLAGSDRRRRRPVNASGRLMGKTVPMSQANR